MGDFSSSQPTHRAPPAFLSSLAMQRLLAFASLVLGAQSIKLRASVRQEPDTSCGKGFDNLVKGSQDYFRTAAVELWTHPSHTMDNATYEQVHGRAGGLAEDLEVVQRGGGQVVQERVPVEPGGRGRLEGPLQASHGDRQGSQQEGTPLLDALHHRRRVRQVALHPLEQVSRP